MNAPRKVIRTVPILFVHSIVYSVNETFSPVLFTVYLLTLLTRPLLLNFAQLYFVVYLHFKTMRISLSSLVHRQHLLVPVLLYIPLNLQIPNPKHTIQILSFILQDSIYSSSPSVLSSYPNMKLKISCLSFSVVIPICLLHITAYGFNYYVYFSCIALYSMHFVS